MAYSIKNWNKFQHFKDRRPPWIKLYRDILDDVEWHTLPDESSKALIMIWLMASENDGKVPSLKELAFRLRKSENKVNALLSTLSHWLIQDDINAVSQGYQCDAPETETEKRRGERETEKRVVDVRFKTFWDTYPRKIGKGAAEKAWEKIKLSEEVFALILKAVNAQKASEAFTKDNGKYIPHPATWLNQRRWEDEVSDPYASLR